MARSDDALLAAASEDAEAFGLFYRRHAAAVLAYLAYRTGDAEEAVDLMAETFAAAFAARRRYRPGPVPALGFTRADMRAIMLVDRTAGASRPSCRGRGPRP